MNLEISYSANKASGAEVAEHLAHCDTDFMPPLSTRINIFDFANTIVSRAERFEAWSDNLLVGLLAAYCNDRAKCIAYITNVSVLKEWTKNGIATHLMRHLIEYTKMTGVRQISLEVASRNLSAIDLYKKYGFVVGKANPPFINMDLILKNEE
jgi:ribosomal protein S18 acetylase RimI-like enzyme